MKISLETQSGIQIHVGPALFRPARPRIDGKPGAVDQAPVARVDNALLAFVDEQGGVLTRSGLLASPTASVGVLFACGPRSIATVLFDLGEEAVRSWLEIASKRGYLPLVLESADSMKLVRLQLDEDLQNLVVQSKRCTPCTGDELVAALQAVVNEIENPQGIAQWLAMQAPLDYASVNVVTPVDIAREERSLH